MTITDIRPVPIAPGTLQPRHIAFIADGNRRWAKAQGTSVEAGFRQGATAVRRTLEQCRSLGLEAASVFLMSDRNFGRSAAEVVVLIDVITELVETEAAASTGPVRILSYPGFNRFPPKLAAACRHAEEVTAGRDGMTVCLGIGYDGRADIRRAVGRALAAADYDDRVELPVDQYLTTAGLPAPDLVVRTSGEHRLSGFLLWQSADATIHFDDRMWPDYDPACLIEALAVASTQTRTFGR
ncbi:polyprenyl diphosphate synthase [Streptomyces sp. BH055]|uniref:polyprenyl diphosphate synthase n=1 Tax=unclassified Streptomyces TaxID=2593676 RepID=UPI003BB5192E